MFGINCNFFKSCCPTDKGNNNNQEIEAKGFQLPTPATGVLTVWRVPASPNIDKYMWVSVKAPLVSGNDKFYWVKGDSSNPYFSVEYDGYWVPPGVTTLQVPIQSYNFGTDGNCPKVSIFPTDPHFTNSIRNADCATNFEALTNGKDYVPGTPQSSLSMTRH